MLSFLARLFTNKYKVTPQARGDTGVIAKKRKEDKVLATSRRFEEFDALLKSIESGAVRPLRGKFLIELYEQGGCVQRRQDLPEHAFWNAADLRILLEELLILHGDIEGRTRFGSLLVALSYRWLSKGHPDPNRFHLAIVADVARTYIDDRLQSGHDGVFGPLGVSGEADFAIFWDFCVLYQEPNRTAEQKSLFREGLSSANIWYGHHYTVTWMQSELPADFDIVRFPTYELSGWCFVEASMSAVLTDVYSRLDLAKRNTPHECDQYCINKPYETLEYRCAARREPMRTPESVATLLRDVKRFTNGADVGIVAMLYEDFFNSVVPEKEELKLNYIDWAASEVQILSLTLPSFVNCREINLSLNAIGDNGAIALARALSGNAMPSLKRLMLGFCEIGDEGGMALVGGIERTSSLNVVWLWGNNFNEPTRSALAATSRGVKTMDAAQLTDNQTTQGFKCRFARLRWENTDHPLYKSSDGPNIHAQLLSSDGSRLNAASIRLLHNTRCGWSHPVQDIEFGRSGVVAHTEVDVEIEIDLGAIMEIVGVESDSKLPYLASFSQDGHAFRTMGVAFPRANMSCWPDWARRISAPEAEPRRMIWV